MSDGVEASLIRSHLLAELTLDEILLSIRDRLLNMTQAELTERSGDGSSVNEAALSLDGGSADVMLDPTVDIRRHLSPIASIRSLSTMLPTSPISNAERRARSFTRLPTSEAETAAGLNPTESERKPRRPTE